ncbi:MAG TPA: hypothetical protein VKZ18_21575 [Polyangia bacterium]|nr:hypothetical protein [Polyangia bacterium]
MKTAMSGLSGLMLGAFLLVGPARADEPATAQQAEAMSAAASQRADELSQLGGTAYKTGLVQQAQADASRYATMADAMEAPPPVTVSSPEAEHYGKLAEDYKLMGGVAYKTGLVQRAEADQRKAQEKADRAAAVPWVDPWAARCDPSLPPADQPACRP